MAVAARTLVPLDSQSPTRTPARRPADRVTAARPSLRVVPIVRRRRAASVLVVLFVTLSGLMLASAAFSANLAPRQVEIDQLDRQLRAERERYGQLRRERAELRSPARLVEAASALGMVTAADSTFLEIDPDVVATVQRASGVVDVAAMSAAEEEFDRLGSVKRTVAVQP